MPNSSPMFLEVEDIFAIGAAQQSRRKSSLKEPLNYTNRAITTFVESVTKMNESVLIPSKLRDVEVRDMDATSLMPVNSDLYSFYQMLNSVKQDLFSNSKFNGSFMLGNSTNNSGSNSGRVTPTGSNGRLVPPTSLALERRLSTSYMLNGGGGGDLSPDFALNSPSPTIPMITPTVTTTALLLSPSSPSSPSPFGYRAESMSNLLAAIGYDECESTNSEERVQQITSCFTHHLNALYTILGHFTRGANYITRRYQEETQELC
ncbi:hypothetical protein RDWZM_004669 [Blomia tropicalis]|uniref:Mid1-interacting protein n=1 Tax=Blomia tropicalis TaxID=40697 RepID=A0A9Q0M4H9_BLOTA|nr:hypothetical protein RDWZM_004669 [Blomia tropicalis]